MNTNWQAMMMMSGPNVHENEDVKREKKESNERDCSRESESERERVRMVGGRTNHRQHELVWYSNTDDPIYKMGRYWWSYNFDSVSLVVSFSPSFSLSDNFFQPWCLTHFLYFTFLSPPSLSLFSLIRFSFMEQFFALSCSFSSPFVWIERGREQFNVNDALKSHSSTISFLFFSHLLLSLSLLFLSFESFFLFHSVFTRSAIGYKWFPDSGSIRMSLRCILSQSGFSLSPFNSIPSFPLLFFLFLSLLFYFFHSIVGRKVKGEEKCFEYRMIVCSYACNMYGQ